jgi:hypothetical protein
VTRGEARPLRPISIPMHRGGERLSSLPNRWRMSDRAALRPRYRAPMPTPRATWLEEPRSVDPDLSRLLSFPRAPPFSGPIPNGSLLRRGPAFADTRRVETRENRAPTRWRGLDATEHERDAFHRVVQRRLRAPGNVRQWL